METKGISRIIVYHIESLERKLYWLFGFINKVNLHDKSAHTALMHYFCHHMKNALKTTNTQKINEKKS